MGKIGKNLNRLWNTLTSVNMFAKSGPGASIESPNIFIFPPHVVDKRNPITVDKNYTPSELLERILGDAQAVDFIGNIFITSMSYHKNPRGVEHEYLLFRVQDVDQRFLNYIKLDRFPEQDPETPPKVVSTPTEDTESAHDGSLLISPRASRCV
jgi:hypothetical protein